MCSQPEIIILGFAALCFKLIFRVFSEKKVVALFKNWTFSECPFLLYTKHFLFCVFPDNYIN